MIQILEIGFCLIFILAFLICTLKIIIQKKEFYKSVVLPISSVLLFLFGFYLWIMYEGTLEYDTKEAISKNHAKFMFEVGLYTFFSAPFLFLSYLVLSFVELFNLTLIKVIAKLKIEKNKLIN